MLSPLIPMALLMAMAVTVRNLSTVGIFERHSVLFVMSFGMAASKISIRLIVRFHCMYTSFTTATCFDRRNLFAEVKGPKHFYLLSLVKVPFKCFVVK